MFRRKKNELKKPETFDEWWEGLSEIVKGYLDFLVRDGMGPHQAAEKVERLVNHELRHVHPQNTPVCTLRYLGKGTYDFKLERRYA